MKTTYLVLENERHTKVTDTKFERAVGDPMNIEGVNWKIVSIHETYNSAKHAQADYHNAHVQESYERAIAAGRNVKMTYRTVKW